MIGSAAEIRVFSELSRVNERGEVVAADRGMGTKPREILSPAVVRNAFASFHILVDAKATEKWSLYIGENPEKALKVSIYREEFAGGVPVRLVAATQPVTGAGPAVIWLDLWVDEHAAVERVKIEPELQVDGAADWITYPMEVRVLSTVARAGGSEGLRVASPEASSDTSGLAALAAWLCQAKTVGVVVKDGPPTVSGFLVRNAAQDSGMMPVSQDQDWLWLATKAADRKAWCKAPARPAGMGSEWYLRIRDRLKGK